MPIENVKGWGVNIRADGTYTLQNRSGWANAAPSQTLISRGGQALCASLVPTSENDTLCLTSIAGREFDNQQITIGRDGMLRQYQVGMMLGGEPLPQ